jgi:hypothetical protein
MRMSNRYATPAAIRPFLTAGNSHLSGVTDAVKARGHRPPVVRSDQVEVQSGGTATVLSNGTVKVLGHTLITGCREVNGLAPSSANDPVRERNLFED